MKKRAFKPNYHCSLLKTNIIEKQSYCGVDCISKKCHGCQHRVDIDHSNDLNPFKLVEHGNHLIDSGCKRTDVLNDIISTHDLSASDVRIVRRNLKHSFK